MSPAAGVWPAYPCGCPNVPGQPALDHESAGHAAFHALAFEQAGIPLGSPVNAETLREARGMKGAPSSAHHDLARQRRMESGQGYFSPALARARSLERGAALRGVRPGAPATSHALSARLSPLKERTVRLDLFALVAAWTPVVGGLTDDDLERMLGRAHQSVSATRNALVSDGYLKDSGRTRNTRYVNPAVVWEPTPGAGDLIGRYARRACVLPEAGCGLPWD